MDVKQLYFNSLFFVYGFVLIVCDNIQYLSYIHVINLLIGVSFLVDFFLSKDKASINTFFKIYIAFVLLTLLSSFLSEDFVYAARKSLTQFLIFFNIFIIYNINKKYNNYMYLVYGIFFALVINFLWLIGVIDLGLTYNGWRFQGTVLQANNFVFILMFGMMMAIYILSLEETRELFKVIMYTVFIISLYMVFFTASKAGLISSMILAILLVLLSVNYRNIFVVLFMLLAGYIIFSYTELISVILDHSTLDLEYTWVNLLERIDSFSTGVGVGNTSTETSTTLRIKMIHDAFGMWSDSPIFGNGIAAFEIKYGHYSHNNIMELLVSFGLLGFILYYLLYVYMFIQIKKIKKKSLRVIFILFLILFFLFDQSIVSYTGKFKILALFILYLSIQNSIRRYESVKE